MMPQDSNRRIGRVRRHWLYGWLAVCTVAGCSVQLPNPIPYGTPFIAKGTFELRSVFGGAQCPVWVDTSGAVYQLFQGEGVSNADFDRVTTPGTTSRLQLKTRDDLIVGCKQGVTVEVQEVMEVLP